MMLGLLSTERKLSLRNAMPDVKQGPPPETIHKRIQRLRKDKGWTQQDLALQVSSREGLDKPLLRQTVTQWEDGSSAPHRDRMAIVAEVLGVSVEELLYGKAIAPTPVASTQQLPLIERRKNPGGVSAPLPVKGEVRDADGHAVLAPFAEPFATVEFPTYDRGAYALRVACNHLAPRYRMGEYVALEPNAQARPGDDVLVTCANGRVLLKLLGWERDGVVQLVDATGSIGVALARAEIATMHAVAGHLPGRAPLKPA
jgi:transcriptional regulator with XRE-family HTH domain